MARKTLNEVLGLFFVQNNGSKFDVTVFEDCTWHVDDQGETSTTYEHDVFGFCSTQQYTDVLHNSFYVSRKQAAWLRRLASNQNILKRGGGGVSWYFTSYQGLDAQNETFLAYDVRSSKYGALVSVRYYGKPKAAVTYFSRDYCKQVAGNSLDALKGLRTIRDDLKAV